MREVTSSSEPGRPSPAATEAGIPAPESPLGLPLSAPPPGYGQPPEIGCWGPTHPQYRVPLKPSILAGRAFVPGWGMYGLTLLAIALGLYASSVPRWDIVVAMVAFLGCLMIGAVWALSFIVSSNETHLRIDRRTWSRWAGVPMLGLAAILVAGSGVPIGLRFEASRSALDQAADQALSGHAPGPGWYGLLPIDSIQTYSDGMAVFVVSGTSGCGYAFHRDGGLTGDVP